MRKIFLTSYLFIATTGLIYSQDYKTGIGLRLGTSAGLTVKHSLGNNNYIEGILSSRWRGFNLTGLYEWQNSFPTENLSWYIGVGGHIGVWNNYYDNPRYYNKNNGYYKDDDRYGVFGVDGILGLEYVFDGAPIGLSIDWKPYVNLLGNSEFIGGEIALSARFLIK